MLIRIRQLVRELASNCHTMVRAVFGSRPLQNSASQSKSVPLRTFLFGAFFASSVFWSCYRASLTSKLIKRDMKMPFNSLETFYNSDFK